MYSQKMVWYLLNNTYDSLSLLIILSFYLQFQNRKLITENISYL